MQTHKKKNKKSKNVEKLDRLARERMDNEGPGPSRSGQENRETKTPQPHENFTPRNKGY